MNVSNKIVNFIKQKSNNALMGSSPNSNVIQSLAGWNFCQDNGFHEVSAMLAFLYYKNVSVLNNAVNIIRDEFSFNVRPMLRNKKTGEIIRDVDSKIEASQILNLFKRSSVDKSGHEFSKELSVNWNVTGNIFILASLSTYDGEPLELYSIKRSDVSIIPDYSGRVGSYVINDQRFMGSILKRDGNGEFYNDAKNWQLWVVNEYDPTRPNEGLSLINPLLNEIDTFIEGKIHNKNLLKKGTRMSGAITLDPDVSDADQKYLETQLKAFYSGGSNAGNVITIPHGTGFHQLSINNKDMDYSELDSRLMEQIYRQYRIPSPLIMDGSKTFNNFSTAIESLYDFVVVPQAKFIYKEIDEFLLNKYKDGNKYELVPDVDNIPALMDREFKRKKELVQLGILTYDRALSLFGEPPLKSGGDILYQPMNLIPVGQTQKVKGEKVTFEKFAEVMKKQNYTDYEIKAKWESVKE